MEVAYGEDGPLLDVGVAVVDAGAVLESVEEVGFAGALFERPVVVDQVGEETKEMAFEAAWGRDEFVGLDVGHFGDGCEEILTRLANFVNGEEKFWKRNQKIFG